MNKLSGGIPHELAKLTFLEVFTMSHNLLVGPIPQGRQFDAFDNSSYDANPGLCGSLLSKKCGNMHEAPSTQPIVVTNEEEDSDMIDWVVRALGCISGFAVGCAIGKYFTDRNHEWFVRTFARRKNRRPRTRLIALSPRSSIHCIVPKIKHPCSQGLHCPQDQAPQTVTWRFIESLEDRARHHIKWPDQDLLEEIKLKFRELYGLPNCCGPIDSTHVVITLPAVQNSDDCKVMWRPDKRKLPSIILACCSLHNIMIDRGDKLHSDIVWPGHHDLGYEEQYCGHTWSSHSGLAPGLELGQAELALPVANSNQNKRTADNRSFRNQEVLKVNYLQIARLLDFASNFTGSVKMGTPSMRNQVLSLQNSCSAHVFSLPALVHSRSSLRLSCPDHESGQIPLQVSKLSKLSVLDLSYNVDPLTGSRLSVKDLSLERLVQNLTHLTYLNLDSVDISSPVPTILTNFTSLEYLSLRESNLCGQFPSSIFGLPYLEYLDLALNSALEGFLPEFQPNSRLRKIFVSGTAFSGEVPPSVGRLAHLETLDLLDGGFSGSIPSALGNLTKLTELDLSGLSGEIPFSLANLTQLETMLLLDVNLDRPQQLHSLLFNLNKLRDLSLVRMNLGGEIPSFISNLTRLERLALSENQLMGQIPPWLMNQTRLEQLYLDKNHLKGQIPQEISQLVHLQWLDFSDNRDLHGNFDPFLKLQFLTNLRLDGVHLAFPEDIATNKSYPKLNFLSLVSCNLAKFPQFLRSEDELELLNLGHNQIHGLIPQWFLSISRESLHILVLSQNFLTAFEHPVKVLPWNYLQVLKLDGNQLQGSLPIPPTSIKIYQVSNNRLVGSIPQQICHAGSLNYLDISNNDLGGQIPNCISELARSLAMLNLRGNNFHGIIPRSYPKSCKLKMINLSQNQLEGRIPKSLVNCSMLVVLDVGQNHMRDTFPSWLASLPNLQILVLRYNNFHGTIMDRSKVTGNFQSLRIIDLSHNFHSGGLPSEFLQIWDGMKITKESQSNTSGTVIEVDVIIEGVSLFLYPEYKYSIIIANKGNDMLYTRISTVFRVIDFSSNNFTGRIPDSIGNLRGLQALNLSNNHLMGRIPSSLSNIIDLESLDLSMNMLSGGIPQELTKLTFLEIFNVSHNLLVGPIPQGNQFDAFDNSSYDENLGLCGSLLSKKCGNMHEAPSTPPIITTNEEEDSEVIDWVIRALGCISGFAVGCAIGKYFTDRNHEWFMEIFGKRKNRRPMTRLQGASRRRKLSLAGNHFTYSLITSELGQLTHLRSADLSYSVLSVQLPSSLTNLTQLEDLALSDLNAVSAEKLYSSLSKLKKLTSLRLFCMNFTTKIPSFITKLTRLEELELGANQLISQIPL
ncbi:hypothetical protein Cgig2_021498 [Carnegiea gigantea]|uniref:Disease resistance R13L4/SHOC-2-like LRR domain-containing protein n=1 Tax=Carnegiea gigantea TaxID=171969 RepID=A0A9Q1QGP5_9CARY|nr:hypothetical protein Cgig2_021498 [Carnegiea gigantea]